MIKNNQDLDRYIKELANDVELNVRNLREKSLMASSTWAKWLSYLFHEKENLDRIVQLKQKLMKKKMQNGPSDSVLRLKSEERLAENDESLQKLTSLQKAVKDNIDYIERALGILSNFGFQIKNTTEIMKLTGN